MNLLNIIKKFFKSFDLFKMSEEFSYKIGEKIYDGSGEEYLKDCKKFCYMMVSTAMWIISAFIICLIFNCWSQCIFILLGFCFTRRLAGGLHLPQHNQCYWTMIMLVFILSFISKISYNFYIISFIMSIGSIIAINFCIPKAVETTIDYSDEEIIDFRRRYSIISCILYFINVIMIYFNYKYNIEILKHISNSLSFGILLSSAMLTNVMEKILKFIWRLK